MIAVSAQTAEIARLGERLRRAGRGARPAYAMAINRAAASARSGMVRSLAKQTGLKQKTTRKALRRRNATAATLSAEINSAGGDIALKFFGPRETKAGVSAAPFGKRSTFGGAFTRGGRFPKRVALSMGGHVFRRLSASRAPIRVTDSGVIIPVEMVQAETRATFYRLAESELPKRLLHELGRRLAAG